MGWEGTPGGDIRGSAFLQVLFFFINLLQLFSFAYDQKLFPIVFIFQPNDISFLVLHTSINEASHHFHPYPLLKRPL